MYSYLTVRIKGTLPQLMHNGLLKNPLDHWAKEIKKISAKRKKTDDDHTHMMWAEWMGSFYLAKGDRQNPKEGSHPYWPNDNIHACIKTAAKQKKLGKVFDSAVIVASPGGRLKYKGPSSREDLWKAGGHRLVKPTSRGIMCCRPMFENWEVDFCLRYLEELINKEELQQLIFDAGRFVGLSDWPRRYGLFDVEGMNEKESVIDVAA